MDKKDNNATEQEKNQPQQLKPIVCPICGSKQIALVTEYRKSIICHIISLILFSVTAFLFIICIINTISNKNAEIELRVAITLSVFLLIIKSYIYYIESKTSIRAICRDCGKTWLLNT